MMVEPKTGSWPWERDPARWQRAIDEVKALWEAEEERARMSEENLEELQDEVQDLVIDAIRGLADNVSVLCERVNKLEERTRCCLPNTMANLADAEEIAEWVRIQKAGQKLADKMYERDFKGRRRNET